MVRLFSLCLLQDGIHWLIIGSDGSILACSPCGFDCEDDARADVMWRV